MIITNQKPVNILKLGSSICKYLLVLLHIYCYIWQAKLGRDKECRSSLQRLRGSDVDISREANTIRVCKI